MWWADCPSHPDAWERLQTVLEASEVDAVVERIEIKTEADAETWRFPGSPTILVNNVDIDPQAGEMAARLTCRLYFRDDGRPSPLPPVAMITRAIDAAQHADTPS